MSKTAKRKGSVFKFEPQHNVPKLGNIKTSWDLSRLYYKSERDPQIEKDLQKAERAVGRFVQKWSGRDFTKSAATLSTAITEYETLRALPELSKARRYYQFRSVLNAKDTVAIKQLGLLEQRFRALSDKLLFFTLTIGDIPKTKQKQFLTDIQLQKYHYWLERVFLSATHNLTESEEKIINLKGSQSYGRWVEMTEKLLANRMVTFKGTTIPFNEALEMIDVLKTADKKKLWDLLITEMETLSAVAEHEFNAIITDVRTEDAVRGYQKPYSATALSYEDTEQGIENLVKVVSGEGFALSKKFYKAKATWHGVAKLHYTQKYDSIGPSLTIPFSQAVDICRDVFYGVKTEYGAIFDRMLTNGQIDVYPKAGKRGGAFMSDSLAHPTHVFLNHLENFKSLETLAHEMGHAIHSERSKAQPPFYQGHSITTAETASTLFENLLFDAVYEQAPEHKKMVLLHDRITRDIATIQRQIAFFNCELEIHETIPKEGAMSKEELASCMYRHLKSYLGPAIALEPRDGYSFVYIPHLRYGFYVYTYTFGILMSTILANTYAADRSYVKEIDAFLSAGQSNDVAGIFKSIGIDITKADTFKKALQNHANDINAFTAFVRQNKK